MEELVVPEPGFRQMGEELLVQEQRTGERAQKNSEPAQAGASPYIDHRRAGYNEIGTVRLRLG
jgi:hypothetical protein